MVGNVNNGGGYACVRPRGIWQMSVHSAQFCCKPKISLKDKVCFSKLLYSKKKKKKRKLSTSVNLGVQLLDFYWYYYALWLGYF